MKLAEPDTSTLRESYREDGMVVLGKILDDDTLAAIHANAERYTRYVVPSLPERVRAKIVRYEADGESIRNFYSMDKVDAFFESLGNREQFLALVREIAGWEPELYTVETFNKTPRQGSKVSMHQESAFHGPDMLEIAHLWLAIDDATEENGPVRYWLGSHKLGMLPHHPDANGYLTCDEEVATAAASEIYTLLLPAGGVAMHNGLIAHDSLPNTSDKPRLAIFCGYRPA
jgi:phytanoyl-CoA hydroxylase